MASTAEHAAHRPRGRLPPRGAAVRRRGRLPRGDGAVHPRCGRGDEAIARRRRREKDQPPSRRARARGRRRPVRRHGDVGVNPARIIPAWHDFVARTPCRVGCAASASRSGRSAAPTSSSSASATSRCSTSRSPTPTRSGCSARTTSARSRRRARGGAPQPPARGGRRGPPSAAYEGLRAIAAPFEEPLPAPPADADELRLRRGHAARGAPARGARARDAGLRPSALERPRAGRQRDRDQQLRHGGGRGVLRSGRRRRARLRDRDSGRIDEPLAGRRRPAERPVGGRGLWMCNQLCDLVQMRTFAGGSVVRLHKRLGA